MVFSIRKKAKKAMRLNLRHMMTFVVTYIPQMVRKMF